MLKSKGQVSYERRGGDLVVHIGGEIDHHSAVSVRSGIDATAAAERPERLMLELSAVDFMDSSGLGLIMGRYALAKQLRAEFAVLDPSPAVIKMMKLSGMERMISILRTKQAT